MRLEIGLAQLRNSLKCEELLFWGKIVGEKSDYFVAMCVHYEGKYEFPDKTFYSASSQDFEFKALPDTLDQHKEFVNLSTNFTGDSKTVLEKLEKAEGEGDEEAGEPVEGEGEGEDL